MVKLVMEILVAMVVVVVVLVEIECDFGGWDMVVVLISSCYQRKRVCHNSILVYYYSVNCWVW
ncbi:hypothetical protein MKX01_041760 [Papaver californicum]|nr:hypothetical protein MKX01_041760 [Papaver californicum]